MHWRRPGHGDDRRAAQLVRRTGTRCSSGAHPDRCRLSLAARFCAQCRLLARLGEPGEPSGRSGIVAGSDFLGRRRPAERRVRAERSCPGNRRSTVANHELGTSSPDRFTSTIRAPGDHPPPGLMSGAEGAVDHTGEATRQLLVTSWQKPRHRRIAPVFDGSARRRCKRFRAERGTKTSRASADVAQQIRRRGVVARLSFVRADACGLAVLPATRIPRTRGRSAADSHCPTDRIRGPLAAARAGRCPPHVWLPHRRCAAPERPPPSRVFPQQ